MNEFEKFITPIIQKYRKALPELSKDFKKSSSKGSNILN